MKQIDREQEQIGPDFILRGSTRDYVENQVYWQRFRDEAAMRLFPQGAGPAQARTMADELVAELRANPWRME